MLTIVAENATADPNAARLACLFAADSLRRGIRMPQALRDYVANGLESCGKGLAPEKSFHVTRKRGAPEVKVPGIAFEVLSELLSGPEKNWAKVAATVKDRYLKQHPDAEESTVRRAIERQKDEAYAWTVRVLELMKD